jgi:hypothetical protein
MLVDGSVLINNRNGSWGEIPQGDFCIDQMILRTYDKRGVHLYEGDVLLACKDAVQVRGVKVSFKLLLKVIDF